MLGKGFADLGEILLEFLHHDVVAVIDRAGADLNKVDQYFGSRLCMLQKVHID